MGYSSHSSCHPLATAWLEASPGQARHELVLTLPEDSLTLVAPGPTGRRVWQKALTAAILDTLGRAESGDPLTAPPLSRQASYLYSRGVLRGARYEGAWLQGKPHGRGRMVYGDGSVHEGGWRVGEKHGRGRGEGAGGGVQEGSWVRGKLEGQGRLWEEMSVYEGGLEDGRPQGHGIMREGRFMGSNASLYVGEWVKGVRQGYGVLEDILAGEKYMGQWEGGVRQGSGCVVTSDGVYYQGNFSSGRLHGPGLMVFEDGAHYRGEFASAGEFSGRGVLVSRGRRYQGSFQGNYTDKMQFSGEMSALDPDSPPEDPLRDPTSPGTVHCTKWASVFQVLHCTVLY